MSHQGRNGRNGGLPRRSSGTIGMGLLIAAWLAGTPLFGKPQLPTPAPPAVVQPQPSPPIILSQPSATLTPTAPGAAIVGREAMSPPAGTTGAVVADPSVPPAAVAVGPRFSSPTSKSFGFRDRRA